MSNPRLGKCSVDAYHYSFAMSESLSSYKEILNNHCYISQLSKQLIALLFSCLFSH